MKPYVCLCVFVLAGILPFAGRAINLDEPQYLHIAKSAVEHDWRFPQDTSWIFFGRRYPNMAAQTHLPVVEYYLAALIKLTGRFDEVPFRLFFAIFPLLAIVSFYRLARHFTASPLQVSFLFAACPAFFVLSPTLMMDIPLLAFLLTGISLYLDSLTYPRRLWPASLCFIMAAGSGYIALIPVGCLLVWAVARQRPKREWLAIAAAPAIILVWLEVLAWHFGRPPAVDLVGYYTSHFSFTQVFLPMFGFLGGIALFPWLHIVFAETSWRRFIVLLSVPAAAALTLFHSWSSTSYRLWYVFLASSGVALLFLFALRAVRTLQLRERTAYGFLLLWFPAVLVFLLLFAEMMSARYILLALPPLFLVVCDRMSRRMAITAVFASTILSVLLAIADYRFVSSYPDFVVRQIVPLEHQGFRVWNAAESGLRFYLERNEIQTLDRLDIRPRGGDLIVRQKSYPYGLSNDLEPLLLNIQRTALLDNYPIRTVSLEAGAGFHDSHFGLVPFIISRAPTDEVDIVEVSPFVSDLPEVVPEDFSSVPVWSPSGVVLKQIESRMTFPLRIPEDTKIEYELEGKGSVTRSGDRLILTKETSSPIVWKNFRIVPSGWPD